MLDSLDKEVLDSLEVESNEENLLMVDNLATNKDLIMTNWRTQRTMMREDLLI
jgi:hypothetical protein